MRLSSSPALPVMIACIALTWATPALAASIESLVMPGQVTSGHADIETECGNCHSAFDQASQTSLCLDCHEEIADDIDRSEGYHGISNIPAMRCRNCHGEHQGRDADIVNLVPERFDHSLTDFALLGGHVDASCSACHAEGEKYREAPSICTACHADDDVHNGGLGEDCGSCHSPEGWSYTQFDHDTATDFALTGAHETTACAACHLDEVYEGTSQDCVSCHALDDAHQGQRGSDCGQCHSTADWKESVFDHYAETGFRLQGKHRDLTCAGCHLEAMALENPPTICVDCHSAEDVHNGRNGSECGDCHSQTTWQAKFDHQKKTGFALRGAHSELSCSQCHRGGLEQALPDFCVGCHADDDPHEDTLGSCDGCHNENTWSHVNFSHEFTRFPLYGQHRLVACEQCHDSSVFAETSIACVECHESDDVHEGSLGDDCTRCHNPGGWHVLTFNHDTDTRFALTGRHGELPCAACHRDDGPKIVKLSRDCGTCHGLDDPHDGQFGSNCARCHTTRSFADRDKLF